MNPNISLDLPSWLLDYWQEQRCSPFECIDDQVMLAITLGQKNIEYQTGGPFGAAIFDSRGKLISMGVNLVVKNQSSILHAEIVAIMLAQQKLQSFDLSPFSLTLASSAEPCAMCMGAIPWSGVTALCFSASDQDVRDIGFDEGLKPESWMAYYASKGIRVDHSVCREAGIDLLNSYNGCIYNTDNKPAL